MLDKLFNLLVPLTILIIYVDILEYGFHDYMRPLWIDFPSNFMLDNVDEI